MGVVIEVINSQSLTWIIRAPVFISMKCNNINNNYNDNLIITNEQFFNKSYVAGVKCFINLFFIQQIFNKCYYMQGTVPDSGECVDRMLNSTDRQNPCLHGVYMLVA